MQCVPRGHLACPGPLRKRPAHRDTRWTSVWKAGGAEPGQSRGWRGPLQPSPCGPGSPHGALGLGSCQTPVPTLSLSHCRVRAGPGTGLWALPSSCLGIRIPAASRSGCLVTWNTSGLLPGDHCTAFGWSGNGFACQNALGVQYLVDPVTPRLFRTLFSLVSLLQEERTRSRE